MQLATPKNVGAFLFLPSEQSPMANGWVRRKEKALDPLILELSFMEQPGHRGLA